MAQMKSRLRKLLRHATSCAETQRNLTGAPKIRGGKLRPVTMPTIETARSITGKKR